MDLDEEVFVTKRDIQKLIQNILSGKWEEKIKMTMKDILISFLEIPFPTSKRNPSSDYSDSLTLKRPNTLLNNEEMEERRSQFSNRVSKM